MSPKEPEEQEEIRRSLASHNAIPVFLDEELAHKHYNGFSSMYCLILILKMRIDDLDQILWPILHYQSGVMYNEETWEAYKKVNEIFADYIADAAQEEDLIWVHDYHLMLLPKLLRERMAKKKRQACIGFSLHTPFPPSESLKVLPVAQDILEGTLSSTLVGFHTEDYRKNFTESCEYLLYVFPPGWDACRLIR